MIEHKAYHKKSLGRPRRRHAARKRGKQAEGAASGFRLAPFLPLALALLGVLLATAAGAAVLSRLSRSSLFTVRSVDLAAGERVSREEALATLGSAARGNLFALSTEEIGKRLLKHPFVRQVSVRKALPDRLVLRITERRPVALLNLDALYYVDEQGIPFKRLTEYDPKGFPIITGFSRKDVASGEPVSLGNLRKTVELLRLADGGPLRRNVSEVHFDPQEGFTLVTRDSGMQLLIGSMEFGEAMRRVEAWLPRLAKLGRNDGVVDLKTEGRIFVRAGD